MAVDNDARDITLNYEGGSLTMALGNAKSLFGAEFDQISGAGEEISVTVPNHTRVRVIGQPAINVAGYTYSMTQYPTSEAGLAKGGKVILLTWTNSDGTWTGRVTGPMYRLGTFLDDNTAHPVVFRTQAGTKYGPFNKEDV